MTAEDKELIGAGAPGPETEITPEMIEAGAAVLADTYGDILDWLARDRARRVYDAMASCSPSVAGPRRAKRRSLAA
jgi:hypothetical protein